MQHTILVIEDNEAIRVMLERALVPEGYHVLLVENGIEALQLLSTMQPCRPGVILMDWRMPKMSGGILLARLRELGYAHRTVVVTAASLKEEDVVAAGARRFLSKPFDLEELLKIVDEMTNTPSAKTEAVRA